MSVYSFRQRVARLSLRLCIVFVLRSDCPAAPLRACASAKSSRGISLPLPLTKSFKHLYWQCYIYWQNPRPLYSFEDNGDYLYDVQWSPIHPALFAAVDGTGRLDLWNLNNDTEVKWLWTSILFQRLDYVLDVVDEGEGRSYFHV